jgi:hypothetical protein
MIYMLLITAAFFLAASAASYNSPTNARATTAAKVATFENGTPKEIG